MRLGSRTPPWWGGVPSLSTPASASQVPDRPVRVIVVDDSPTMRAWISFVIDKDPRLHVVGQAADAHEARLLIKELDPDVLTLDLAMPEMNGLDFLTHLMRLRPMPVIVFSGLVANQGKVAAAAMKLGAFACIPKPSHPDPAHLLSLCDTLVEAGVSRHTSPARSLSDHVVLVGASTGGVAAIETVLAQFSATSPPVVIAQHMPQRFLLSFAERLDRLLPLEVQLAQTGATLEVGHVYLATAEDRQTCLTRSPTAWQIATQRRTEKDLFCPSVDRLFLSAVPWAQRVGAMLLTGLGEDGARGMLALSRGGARTIIQSRDTCIVYGMPGAAHALGAAECEVDLDRVGKTLLHMMKEGA